MTKSRRILESTNSEFLVAFSDPDVFNSIELNINSTLSKLLGFDVKCSVTLDKRVTPFNINVQTSDIDVSPKLFKSVAIKTNSTNITSDELSVWVAIELEIVDLTGQSNHLYQ